jgi:hypothetical protein
MSKASYKGCTNKGDKTMKFTAFATPRTVTIEVDGEMVTDLCIRNDEIKVYTVNRLCPKPRAYSASHAKAWATRLTRAGRTAKIVPLAG